MKIIVTKPIKCYADDGFDRSVIWLHGIFRRGNNGYFRDRRRMIARAAMRENRRYIAISAMQPLDEAGKWWWFDPRSEA